MSSTKTFVIGVNPRDVLVDLKGVSPKAANAYIRFWMLHALHGEPLPPREEKKPVDEWDAWFRDKLDMKNVRGWIVARDELIALSKIRVADDGRLYIGRTMRDAEKRRGGDPSKWSGDGDAQGDLGLSGVHWAQRALSAQGAHVPVDRSVGDAVEPAGAISTSAEVSPNFVKTSAEVTPIFVPKSLIWRGFRPALSRSNSKSHERVAVIPFGAARARGDPAALRA